MPLYVSYGYGFFLTDFNTAFTTHTFFVINLYVKYEVAPAAQNVDLSAF